MGPVMKWLSLLAFLGLGAPALAYTESPTGVFTTDGSQADVEAALAVATSGERVIVPIGTFTWGASADQVQVQNGVTLEGEDPDLSIIQISSSAVTQYGTVHVIGSGSVIKDLTFLNSSTANCGHIAAVSNGWRITGCSFLNNGGATTQAVIYTFGWGLIDNCYFNTEAGSERIFAKGPTDSWQTADSLGGADNLFVEDCTLAGAATYFCDINANGRAVFRFNTLSSWAKIDGHGKASNTPARGVRHMEVYHNTWTTTTTTPHATMEFRGGSGYAFNNTTNGNQEQRWNFLTEYGCTALWPNFGNVYQTPDDYPIDDQIGVGIDPKTAASAPFYYFGNRGAGNANWHLEWKPVPAGAHTEYGAPFSIQGSIIVPNRDFFCDIAAAQITNKTPAVLTFDGTEGVGIGVKADIEAGGTHETASLAGVGYWVTDEGEWNSNSPGADGQFYVWDGAAWNLEYTPYTYPHPLRSGDPAPTGAAYGGRLRFNGTGSKPVLTDGTGSVPIKTN